MRSPFVRPPRRLGLLCGAIALAAVVGPATSPVLADDPPVTRIVEYWRIEIDQPDVDGDAPQIICAMSSTAELADVHSLFEINHRSLPNYQGGGLQLQVWSGDHLVDVRPSPWNQKLSKNNEVITFTNKMVLANGKIEFDVDDGSSTTWGNFGNQGHLITWIPTTQTDLSQYDPDTSIKNSYVGYAADRVKTFKMTKVEYYAGNTLLSTDATERVVHQLDTAATP